MDCSIRKQDWLVLAAALGLAGALLFTNAQGDLLGSWGPNLLVWILLALGALALMARQKRIGLSGDGLWLIAPLLFFAASFIYREDTFLRFWNGVFLLVSAGLLVTRCRVPWRVAAAGYTEYIRLCALAAAHTLFGPVPALRGSPADRAGGAPPPRVVLPSLRLGEIGKAAPPAPDLRASAAANAAAAEVESWFIDPKQAFGAAPAPPILTPAPAAPARTNGALPRDGFVTPAAVLKGILLSAVPLGAFGCLFASADPVFAHLWDVLFNWNFSALAWHIVWGALLGWIGIGLLHTALQREPAADQLDRDLLPDGTVAPRGLTALFHQGGDIVVALVLIDLLFAAFVAVQFNFLFGGESAVRSVPGLSYAAYGRGGFFELAWVAGLALPMLLLAHWLTRASSEAARLRVRCCTGVLILLLFIIVASAFKRMALYEMAWGMTEKRLLVSVFIGAISMVFLWFLATVWRSRPQRFAIGLLVAAMLTIGGLDLFNTDSWVVNVDAHRSRGLTDFRADYLEGLGTDAAPALAVNIDRLAPADQPSLASFLLGGIGGWNRAKTNDWRIWNASDAAADRAVVSRRALLSTLAAKIPKQSVDDADCGCDAKPAVPLAASQTQAPESAAGKVRAERRATG